MSIYMRYSIRVFQITCASQLFSEHVAEATFCFGPSMLPTLNVTGDFVAYEHWTQRHSSLETGDVIVAASPQDPSRLICKRIIGMGGDKVCIDPVSSHRQYITVPPGHIWVTGDNLAHSTDSRDYGPLALGLVQGRAFARLWPHPKWIGRGLEKVAEFA